MKILVYHGKHGDEYWLADTPEQLEAAMRNLFTFLDKMCCYEEQEGIEKARSGDFMTIKWILDCRYDYEYERWEIEEVRDPCTT